MTFQESRLAELAAGGSPLLRMAMRNDVDFDLDRLMSSASRLLDGLAGFLSDGRSP